MWTFVKRPLQKAIQRHSHHNRSMKSIRIEETTQARFPQESYSGLPEKSSSVARDPLQQQPSAWIKKFVNDRERSMGQQREEDEKKLSVNYIRIKHFKSANNHVHNNNNNNNYCCVEGKKLTN